MNPDYVVTVYCDDPSHDERVISEAGHFPKPTDKVTVGWLEWRELVHDDANQPPSLQTPFGEKLLRGGHDLGGPAGTPKGMDYATRWRFECDNCRTLPVRGEVMEKLLDQLRIDGRVSRISLRAISARLTM